VSAQNWDESRFAKLSHHSLVERLEFGRGLFFVRDSISIDFRNGRLHGKTLPLPSEARSDYGRLSVATKLSMRSLIASASVSDCFFSCMSFCKLESNTMPLLVSLLRVQFASISLL
jgi:hypothetical protein